MPRDDVGAAGDRHLMDVTADQHLAVTVGGRYRVIIAAVAHQGQRADPARLLVAGVVRRRRQGLEGRKVAYQPFADRLGVTAQSIAEPPAAVVNQLGVERRKARRPRHRHQVVAPDPADQAFDLALVVALAGAAEPVFEQVVRLQFAEHPRPLSRPVAQNPGYRDLGIMEWTPPASWPR